MIIFKLAFKDIFKNKKFSSFFVANLTFGLIGLLTLNIFNLSFKEGLSLKSKEILSADLSISARRLLENQEMDKIEASFPIKSKTRTVQLFTMAQANGIAKLIRVRGIEPSYPLIGVVETQKSSSRKNLHSSNSVWVYPELATQFGIKSGDSIKIGNKTFKIEGIITKDSSDASRGVTLAPRAYLDLEKLLSTGLISEFSTLFDNRYYILKENALSPQVLHDKLESEIHDTTIRITSPNEASEQLSNIFGRLNDFMGLVVLVALFLSLLGMNYLFRSYIHKKRREAAILKSLGLTHFKILGVYSFEVFLFSLISTSLAFGVSLLTLPFLKDIALKSLNIEFPLIVSTENILFCFLIGIAGSLLAALPLLQSILSIKTSTLLNMAPELKFKSKTLILYIPSLVFFYLLALYQSKSFVSGTAFYFSLLACAIILYILAQGFLFLLGKLKTKNIAFRLGIRNIKRDRIGSFSLFVTIGLGSLLLNFIPQLENSLQKELQGPQSDLIPSLFLFDIQEEQVDPLRSFLKKEGSELKDISPLVRAKLLKVNGQSFEKKIDSASFSTREEQSSRRFRNRGINLSYYMNGLPEHKIVDGKPFSEIYDWESDKLPEVSIEKRYAQRLGIKLQDKLLFDVQGLEVEAKVINIRSVNWLSFRPNFFVEMQPGSISDAPKIFIGILTQLTDQKRADLQFKLSQNYPSISIVDISSVIKEIIKLTSSLQKALILVAMVSLIVGLFVLYSISHFESVRKIQEVNLVKVLGGNKKLIFSMSLTQFLTPAFIASLGGLILSCVLSYGICNYIFDIAWSINPVEPILSLILLNSLAFLVSYIGSQKVIQSRPSEIFRLG